MPKTNPKYTTPPRHSDIPDGYALEWGVLVLGYNGSDSYIRWMPDTEENEHDARNATSGQGYWRLVSTEVHPLPRTNPQAYFEDFENRMHNFTAGLKSHLEAHQPELEEEKQNPMYVITSKVPERLTSARDIAAYLRDTCDEIDTIQTWRTKAILRTSSGTTIGMYFNLCRHGEYHVISAIQCTHQNGPAIIDSWTRDICTPEDINHVIAGIRALA